MKHQRKRYKLGRTCSHRGGLWHNLMRSLFLHGKIITTDAKAKAVSVMASKLITMARGNEDLATYRKLLSNVRGDEVVAKKLFDYGKKFEGRAGGYFSIVKIGSRQGDGAPQSCIMVV